MGSGFLFFLFMLFLVPVGVGVLIGYFIGKSKGRREAAGAGHTSQADLAAAWQEGYQAGQNAPREPIQRPAPQPSAPAEQPAQPQAQPAQPDRKPETPPAPPSTPVRPQPTPAAPQAHAAQQVPAHLPQSAAPHQLQHFQPTPGFIPPPLSPEQLAQQREKQQIRNANILLYVAALLMVGTGMLFLGAGLPLVITVGALGFVTAGFYAAGLLLHKYSPRLRSSGTAFTGTGLALYPIFALAAANQIWPGSPWPWLAFSIIGSIGFSVAAAILNSRIVAFLTVPFFLSMGVAAGSVLRSGMVWSFVFTIVVATIISWFAAEKPRWMKNIFVHAFVHTHEYIVPATLVAQFFLFPRLTDLQNTLVFAAALLYYITRSVLSIPRYKLYYLSAARALFLLTLWQTLRTLNVPGSTIAIVMALGLAATIITTLLAQRRYLGLLQRSERSQRFAANWIGVDLGLHTLGLLALAWGTERTINPNLFGQNDIASLNLPLVITMITLVIGIVFHQRSAAANMVWGRTLGSPLWFLIAPFWATRASNESYGGEFFRPEVFWILGLIGFGIAMLRSRREPLHQLIFTIIGATVLYLIVRTHVGVANTSASGQTMTIVVALWAIAAVLWVFTILKLFRGTRILTDAAAAEIPDQPARPWHQISERLAGYIGAAGTGFALWMSLGAGHASRLRASDYQQSIYLLSMLLVLAVVTSFGLILLRNMRLDPAKNSLHAALWAWAFLGLVLGIRERSFLATLDPGSAHWFSLIFGLVLVTVVWLGGYFTAKLRTESAAIKARWYQTAAALGLGYALLNGLRVLQADSNLTFAVPLLALLGYFLYLIFQDGTRTTNALMAGSASTHTVESAPVGISRRLYNHQIGSAGLVLVMPLYLLLDVPHFNTEFSSAELFRWALLVGWVLFGVLVLWYALRHFIAYLPLAAFGFMKAAGIGALYRAMAGENRTPIERYWNETTAAWIMVLLGAGVVLLLLLPLRKPDYQQRWKTAGIWAPLAAYAMLGAGALWHTSNGYVWGIVGLLLATAMIISSYHNTGAGEGLRPAAVPVIFLAFLPLADRLQSDLFANTENYLPVWLIAGFLGGATGYLIGLFCVGGPGGERAGRNTRLTTLITFLVFMVYGWTDSKAALIFAVILTLVGMLGLGREMVSRPARRTVWELMLIVAVLGAQRIWADVPANDVDQRVAFWFIQHLVLALALLATMTGLRARRTGGAPTQSFSGPVEGVYAPVVPEPVVAVTDSSTRFNSYLFSSAGLLSLSTFLMFGLTDSTFEFFWILAAFVALIIYGAIASRTGVLIWGILGVVLVLMIFLRFGSVLLLFPLALALMGVGIWQLIRITRKPTSAATLPPGPPGAVQQSQPPYGAPQPPAGYYPPAGQQPPPAPGGPTEPTPPQH
ncbi:hypothetical protein [Micrococcoides hystricis]|uniref:DUF2339 domain-containing protein n=1 Tax=Micrococcoides hystricis TaxID=1572761 RepID=A0ABV6P9K2_9MICC